MFTSDEGRNIVTAPTGRFFRKTPRATILVVALLIAVVPLLLMLLTSVEDQSTAFTHPLSIPWPLQWNNYVRAWQLGGLVQKAVNSLIVTVASVLIATVLGSMVAYACARVRNRVLSNVLLGTFALGLVVPIQSGIVPLFIEIRALHLLGTLAPMILVDAVMVMPVTVLLLTAFFRALPLEVEEAAGLDGAGRMLILVRIVMPMARPAVVTSVILGLVTVWNDYFVSLVFATDPSLQTLPLGLSNFHIGYQTDWPGILAYSTLIAVPVLLVYIFLQRQITDGVTLGASR